MLPYILRILGYARREHNVCSNCGTANSRVRDRCVRCRNYLR